MVGPQDDVLVDDHPERPARAHRDGGLDVEHALDEMLADLVARVLGGFADGTDEVVPGTAEGELRANAQERRKSYALDQPPGVEIDLVLEAGIAGRVGRRQVLDDDRGPVREDEPLPLSTPSRRAAFRVPRS